MKGPTLYAKDAGPQWSIPRKKIPANALAPVTLFVMHLRARRALERGWLRLESLCSSGYQTLGPAPRPPCPPQSRGPCQLFVFSALVWPRFFSLSATEMAVSCSAFLIIGALHPPVSLFSPCTVIKFRTNLRSHKLNVHCESLILR